MGEPELRDDGRDDGRDDAGDAARGPAFGVTLVAATYIYFLLFAQFGFLDHLQATLADARSVESAMTFMGLTGLAASFLAGWRLRERFLRTTLVGALLGCALASGLAPLSHSQAGMNAVGAAVGLFTALLTVTVAANLRTLLPGRAFAIWVGLGTGSAYFVCNLPPLFEGSVFVRCWFPGLVCLCMAVWTAFARLTDDDEAGEDPEARPDEDAAPFQATDYAGLGFASVVLSFLALIWFDSAAFAIIQENAAFKSATWGTADQKLMQGLWHFVAAVGAGFLLDRGWLRSLLVAAFALLCSGLGNLDGGTAAGPLYVIGVSFYSTALVAFPGMAPAAPGLIAPRWRSALLYGVAGWIGSALGVGMAQNLHEVPSAFLVAAATLLVAGLLLARRSRPGPAVIGVALPVAIAALAVAIEILATGGVAVPRSPQSDDPVLRGRAVYIAEGCINCHSQYVRPDTRDVALWGPTTGMATDLDPPLPGNRRQGPDLSQVGNRRSRVWQRLHLIDPRALNPWSRMPSYAHLFEDGRGGDLVAYLLSLGAATTAARWESIQAFAMPAPDGRASRGRGAALFASHCAGCHGEFGRGGGHLSDRLDVPNGELLDLAKPTFALLPQGEDAEPLPIALARLIKFGMINTSMRGHETFSDADLYDLVGFIEGVREGARATTGTATRDVRS